MPGEDQRLGKVLYETCLFASHSENDCGPNHSRPNKNPPNCSSSTYDVGANDEVFYVNSENDYGPNHSRPNKNPPNCSSSTYDVGANDEVFYVNSSNPGIDSLFHYHPPTQLTCSEVHD
jgi:hypothetical protein